MYSTKQKGFSLIEMMLTAAVIILATAFLFNEGRARIRDAEIDRASAGIQKASEVITLIYRNNGSANYATISNANAIAAQAFGGEFQTGGANLAIQGGGAINVAPIDIDAVADQFSITVSDISREACNGIAAEIGSNFRRVQARPSAAGAWNTVKDDNDFAPDAVNLTVACTDAGAPFDNYDNQLRFIGG